MPAPRRRDARGARPLQGLLRAARARGRLPRIRITDFRSGAVPPHRVPGAGLPSPCPSTTASSTPSALRFDYQSPITSSSIYDYDPATRERKLLKQVEVLGGYDPSRYKVELTRGHAPPDGVQGPDLAGLPEGPEARRQQPGAALRLRLVRLVEDGRLQLEPLQPPRPRRRLRHGLHPRRRRAGQEVARPGPDAQEEEHVHRLHRRRRAPGRRRSTRARTGSPSRAAAPAACSWARSPTCGPTSSRSSCRTCRSWTSSTPCSTSRCR